LKKCTPQKRAFQLGVEAFGQRGDRQARGVRGEDGVRRDVRRDLLVQVVLPVHALGDGFDDQVAAGQHVEVVLVVGDFDQRGVVLVAQRRRRQLFQVLDGAQDDAVLVALLAGRSNSTTGTLALTQCAAICAPITPAPSTATFLTMKLVMLVVSFALNGSRN
jgi:hypothetical protein